MRIVTFEMQTPDSLCVDLDVPGIDKRAYPGQDSVVFRDLQAGRAVHVYNCPFESVLSYARCVNAAYSLNTSPFSERVVFQGADYISEARVNPVEEAGEKTFRLQGKDWRRAYTVSPFIDAVSLCWPEQTDDEERKSVARCFNMIFYDRVNEWIESRSNLRGIDINPVNVKYIVDREHPKISLVITDLAKNVGDVQLRIAQPQ